jgi:hypothetical protein
MKCPTMIREAVVSPYKYCTYYPCEERALLHGAMSSA